MTLDERCKALGIDAVVSNKNPRGAPCAIIATEDLSALLDRLEALPKLRKLEGWVALVNAPGYRLVTAAKAGRWRDVQRQCGAPLAPHHDVYVNDQPREGS